MDVAFSDFKVARIVAGIALVLLFGSLLSMLFRRLRQPPVIGEITAGILLGPSILGQLPGNLTATLFPAELRPHLSMIAQVGLLLFMFLIGWEFNSHLLRKATTAVVSVSLSAIVLSFGLGAGLATLLYSRHDVVDGQRVPFPYFAAYLGIAMSITAFPVLARILNDSGMMRTRIGALVLASAALDDVLAWMLLAVIVAGFTAGGTATFVSVFGFFIAYIVLTVLAVRPFLRWLVSRFTSGDKPSPYLLPVIAAGIFLSAFATSWIGVHAIFGAFAFGLAMPREPLAQLARHLREPLDNATRILLPIFFIITGLSIDLGAIGLPELGELVLILLVACAGKLIGAGIPARLSGMSWRDSYSVGLLMNTRGLTELVILNIGVAVGVLDGRMFTMMVLMALFTTAMAGPLLPRRVHQASDGAFLTERGGTPAAAVMPPGQPTAGRR